MGQGKNKLNFLFHYVDVSFFYPWGRLEVGSECVCAYTCMCGCIYICVCYIVYVMPKWKKKKTGKSKF